MKSNPALKDDVKVEISDVRYGMFIHSLDIPWNKTPFMFEGLLLSNEKQMEVLHSLCEWVIVSKRKSSEGVFPAAVKPIALPATTPKANAVIATSSGDAIVTTFTSVVQSVFNIFNRNRLKENYNPLKIHKSDQSVNEAIKEDFAKLTKAKLIRTQFKNDDAVSDKLVNHLVTESVFKEVKQAKVAQVVLVDAAAQALSSDLSESELNATVNVAKEAISSVVDSISRNPDAMQLVSQIKSLDRDSYQHAIDASLLMIAFGREICLPKNDLVELGLGGLLHDVGEIKQPDSTAFKRIKNITKFKIYKSHIEDGIKISISANHSSIVKQIISNHHEYYDGSGYPRGICKGQLGMYGNMIVIVDTYISLISGRSCDMALPQNKALEAMHKQREKFHPQLFDQFIQMVGLFPVGSTVRLSSGDIGMVIKQNRAWRLKPVVMVVMDKKGKVLDKPIHINLLELKGKNPIYIAKEISSDQYNLLVADFIN